MDTKQFKLVLLVFCLLEFINALPLGRTHHFNRRSINGYGSDFLTGMDGADGSSDIFFPGDDYGDDQAILGNLGGTAILGVGGSGAPGAIGGSGSEGLSGGSNLGSYGTSFRSVPTSSFGLKSRLRSMSHNKKATMAQAFRNILNENHSPIVRAPSPAPAATRSNFETPNVRTTTIEERNIPTNPFRSNRGSYGYSGQTRGNQGMTNIRTTVVRESIPQAVSVRSPVRSHEPSYNDDDFIRALAEILSEDGY